MKAKYTFKEIIIALTGLMVFGLTAIADAGSANMDDDLRNCAPLASHLGAENVWFGHVSGLSSMTIPWSEIGCFVTEKKCRRWLLRSYPAHYPRALSCRRGAPKWSTR